MTCEKTHVFETAGLGKAPFHFVGAYEKRGPIDLGNGLTAGAPGQPMGTCQFCGTGIAICCEIESSDGHRFVVGSDCVHKADDTGLRRTVDRAIRNRKADAIRAREDARISEVRNRVATDEALRQLLIETPSSNYYSANRLEWVEWMLKNAGHSGQMRVTKYIESL